LDYRPNLDGAAFLVKQVLPRLRERRPDVRVVLVGRGSSADLESFRGPGVEVTGEVPDVRPYLSRAAAVAVPIRTGSGTRLKVVEGLAMGKPLVSTTVGCEGIDVRHEEHLLIADTAEAFTDELARVLADPDYGRTLGRAGRRKMVDAYSWDYAGELLESLYRQVLGSKPVPWGGEHDEDLAAVEPRASDR
jgi:glycosyltransferase involved in cell wall biosynthesis